MKLLKNLILVSSFALILTLCILPSLVLAETSYLCMPDEASGFRFNPYQKSWEPVIFKVAQEKILLKKSDRGWEWVKFGHKYGSLCKEMDKSLQCDIYVGEVLLNRNTLRYIETYMIGYVNGSDNNDNTPFIAIGRCTPLEINNA
jgi:hypothetical protein